MITESICKSPALIIDGIEFSNKKLTISLPAGKKFEFIFSGSEKTDSLLNIVYIGQL